jgi:hypothetical protein
MNLNQIIGKAKPRRRLVTTGMPDRINRRNGTSLSSSPHRRPPSGSLADEMPRPLDRRRPRGHVPRAIRSTQSLGCERRLGGGSEGGDRRRGGGGDVAVEEVTPPRRRRLHRRRRWWSELAVEEGRRRGRPSGGDW